MFHTYSIGALAAIFLAAAGIVWVAGIALSNTTDTLSKRYGLGEALGGLILLAITTNLPEIAITLSASLQHVLDIAIGNILGGIAMQTVVLALLDLWGLGKQDGLTYRAASLVLVLEGILVVAVLVLAIMGSQLPPSVYFLRMTPASVMITIFWVVGLWLLNKARKGLPWHEQGEAPDNQRTRKDAAAKSNGESKNKSQAMGKTWIKFTLASVATLVAGIVLERSGEQIAVHIHMTGVLFGATALAAATSLPELSTGLQSVKMGDYQLAFSDIFGGNAFLLVLFLMADIVSGQAVLPQALKSDLYLTALGVLLTTVYICGLIFRPRRQLFNMGIDSLAVLIIYAIGMVGLAAITQGR